VLAIAHNGNLSHGLMFPVVEAFGKTLDRDYAETRVKPASRRSSRGVPRVRADVSRGETFRGGSGPSAGDPPRPARPTGPLAPVLGRVKASLQDPALRASLDQARTSGTCTSWPRRPTSDPRLGLEADTALVAPP
jgi:hypothetical protein